MATQLASGSSTRCFQQQRISRVECRRALVVRAAKPSAGGGRKRLDSTGYIVDNSNSGNIFAREITKPYVSSPRADKAAKQGLGGEQGLLVVAGLMGIVALATAAVGGTGDTLQEVAATADSLDSLSAIASRLTASL